SLSLNAHLALATHGHRSCAEYVSTSGLRCWLVRHFSASPRKVVDALRNLARIDQNAGAGFECPEMPCHVLWRDQADVQFFRRMFGSRPVVAEHRRQQKEFRLADFEQIGDRPWERRGSDDALPIDPQAPHLPDNAKIKSIHGRKLPRMALADLALHRHPLTADCLFNLPDRQARHEAYFYNLKRSH